MDTDARGMGGVLICGSSRVSNAGSPVYHLANDSEAAELRRLRGDGDLSSTLSDASNCSIKNAVYTSYSTKPFFKSPTRALDIPPQGYLYSLFGGYCFQTHSMSTTSSQ